MSTFSPFYPKFSLNIWKVYVIQRKNYNNNFRNWKRFLKRTHYEKGYKSAVSHASFQRNNILLFHDLYSPLTVFYFIPKKS